MKNVKFWIFEEINMLLRRLKKMLIEEHMLLQERLIPKFHLLTCITPFKCLNKLKFCFYINSNKINYIITKNQT